MIALVLLGLPALAFARDFIAEGEDCIAGNSGAASVECLERLYYESNQEIRRLEDRFVAQARQRRRNDDIGETHYALAVSAMRDASRRFQKFSERQCDAEVAYFGGVASGYGQGRFTCLLNLNEGRKAYLRRMLKGL
ncbi:DUF1311 domain-containing protein [Pseudomonas sp. PDNC002]|uniref:lysozyme inhibitor LprI family protein n=1 Tax=Pseudomonas sp. PDNC002 TaxID=2811422 RepID=UPI0019637506|nr:lysozyme inhibitor LprI family protein [Pseudomonas sp. PDNC002]QRY78943.1 DUF1311 domain-containing protein [Pseudomonas sp. PDNC002]